MMNLWVGFRLGMDNELKNKRFFVLAMYILALPFLNLVYLVMTEDRTKKTED